MKVVALEGIEAMLRIGDRKMKEEESENNPYLPLVAEIEGKELIVLHVCYVHVHVCTVHLKFICIQEVILIITNILI